MRIEPIYRKVKERITPFLDIQNEEVMVLIVLARKKYGSEFLKSSRVVLRETITMENYEIKLQKALTLMMNYYSEKENLVPYDCNLYLQVNPRSVRKAMRNMKIRIAEHDYDNKYEYAEHLHGLWMSCLQKKAARSRRKYYIVDVDTTDKTFMERVKEILPPTTIVYNTRKGFHLITEPFNVQKFMEVIGEDKKYLEVKPDDCVMLWAGNWDEHGNNT
jgi:hypothetical protein